MIARCLSARTQLRPAAARSVRSNVVQAARPVAAQQQRRLVTVRSDTGSAVATAAEVAPQHAITLTDNALSHLRKLQKEAGSESLLLRVGVKQGGCSGMSYVMDFETDANIKEDDYIVEYEGGFRLACDPKSLLYLFGMSLDYSDALIGGGFNFSNPNAESSCGCGKSFSV
ncbi:hypothetical protein OEZ86_012458 [Tetradesmus obliquus]|nr:hypothetical protein OEZ86_012458 [Tetradesmus obliquus]